MVSFLAAFSFMCFENSNFVTRTLVAILWAAVAALILWCIFTAWESGDWEWFWGGLSCWRPASADADADADEGDGDAAAQDKAENEGVKSDAGSEYKPPKRRWTLQSIAQALRKGSVDSQRTYV